MKNPSAGYPTEGFVSDINCDLYIFPLTWLEMMHIGERIHELVCIFLVDRQFCDFQRPVLRGKPYYHFRGKPHHHFNHADNDNKIPVLLSKTAELQGFSGKKRPHRIASARSIFIFGFISGFAQNQDFGYYFSSLIAACMGRKKRRNYPQNTSIAFAVKIAVPFPPAESMLSVISPPAA